MKINRILAVDQLDMSGRLVCAVVTELEKNNDKLIASKGDKSLVEVIMKEIIPKVPNTNHKKVVKTKEG